MVEQSILKNWTSSDFKNLQGRTAIVTGASGGLGYECACMLAKSGADVIVAARNAEKGKAALLRITSQIPNSRARFEQVDLSSINSMQSFAQRLLNNETAIDILINNAAVMAIPTRKTTEDGFEMQFGTNHLGHFYLTAALLPLLKRANAPRITTVSSLAHKRGTINFDDLQAERRYIPWVAYQQSKLANILFAFELQRRANQAGWNLLSNAAHPGFARTDIISNGPGSSAPLSRLYQFMQPFLSHSAESGALPILFGAAADNLPQFGYYGPGDLFEVKGPVANASVSRKALDDRVAKKLFDVSEQLLRIQFSLN